MRVKLPPLTKVTSYVDFYKYVTRKLKQPKGTKIYAPAVSVNPENEETIQTKIREFDRKRYKGSKHFFDADFDMLALKVAPTCNGKILPGYAEIDVEKIFQKEK